jgi:para-aminobenzoate synthetase component 1
MLLTSGGFLGKPNKLYKFPIKELKFFNSLLELKERKGFVVISYKLSEETLGVKVKASSFPPIVFVEVGEPVEFEIKPKPFKLSLKGFSLNKEEYIEKIRRIKEEIERGTVYQLNLSTRMDFKLEGSPLDLFLKFFERQPTPYAFFLDLKDFYILSGSMELFLEKKGGLIKSKPIKGTAESEEILQNSQKDKAENLMILDMMRNDLSRVAKVGSVKVEELFKVEKYATLCQMHSTVVAQTDKDLGEILLNTFPPASVTGAPKKKAVELIDDLEPHPRDYYCGCAGFVWNEDFTLCVLIRTAFGSGQELSYYAGSGIVYDSDEEKEWEETLSKAKAFWSM